MEAFVVFTDGRERVVNIRDGSTTITCPVVTGHEVDEFGISRPVFGAVTYQWDGTTDAEGRRIFR